MHPYIKAYLLVQHAKYLLTTNRISQSNKDILVRWIARKEQFMSEAL